MNTNGCILSRISDSFTDATDWPLMIQHGEYQGGPGGFPFNDIAWWRYRQITGIALECTDKIMLGIQIKYGDIWAPKRGGVQEEPCQCDYPSAWCRPEHNHHVMNVTLDSDERVTSVNMTMGRSSNLHNFYILHFATISTNKRVFNTCGNDTPTSNATTVHLEGHRLEFISGKRGCVIDGLQLHWSKDT